MFDRYYRKNILSLENFGDIVSKKKNIAPLTCDLSSLYTKPFVTGEDKGGNDFLIVPV